MSEPKETEPKVTVIMPSLNVAPFIRECMESVLRQTLMEIEIICVDAGSNDGTAEILQEYAAKDPRITLLHSDYRSYGHQVNMGIDAARGEYLGIVETDDFIRRDMYQCLTEVIEREQTEVVRCDYWELSGEGPERRIRYMLSAAKHLYGSVFCPVERPESFGGPTNPWNGIYRTDFLRNNRIRFNETPGASYQDTGFFFQVLTKAKRFYFVNAAFVFYRIDNESSSRLDLKKVYAICDECDFLRNTLKNDPERESSLAPLAAFRRFRAYRWNLFRIDAGQFPDFLIRFSTDFKNLRDAGELGDLFRKVMGPADAAWLEKVMDTPETYLRETTSYEGMITGPGTRPKDMDQYRKEIEAIRNSTTYRVGMIFTGIPGRIKDALRGR